MFAWGGVVKEPALVLGASLRNKAVVRRPRFSEQVGKMSCHREQRRKQNVRHASDARGEDSPQPSAPAPFPGRFKGRAVFSWIVAGVFFVLYYLYVRHCLDPRLLYHANDVALPSGQSIEFPIYLRGTAFFQGFVGHPGGPIEYLSALCSQYYYYPLWGPLVLTVVACLAYLFSDWLIRLGGSAGARPLRYVPPLLLLIVYSQYTFHLENCIAPVAALMAAVGYALAAKRVHAAPIRLVLFCLAAGGLYLAVGGPFVLFAVWCGLYELLGRRRYVLGGSCLLIGLGIPLLGMCLFNITPVDAYCRPAGVWPSEKTVSGVYSSEDTSPEGYSLGGTRGESHPLGLPAKTAALAAFYLFFVLVAACLPFGRRLASLRSALASRTGRVGRYCLSGKLTPVYGLLALAAAGACVAWCTPDRSARAVLRANYLARMEMWPEFLEQIERYPSREYPGSVMLDVNRALFETGKLGSRMFAYPQNRHTLLRLGSLAASCKGGCEILLELGRINEAEHAALEALEITGERPETLRLLATIYIVKRRGETARVFLGTLSKDVVHGQWARERLRRLEEDPLLSSDPKIRRLRSIMPQADMPIDANSQETMLLALLARNPKNRMAFEYLMAYYLLSGQGGKVACNISRLDDFDEWVIPEHYGEAILVYSYKVRRPVDLGPRRIDPITVGQVRQVLRLGYEHREDKEALDEVLAERFPGSCWRYFLTGGSGGAR